MQVSSLSSSSAAWLMRQVVNQTGSEVQNPPSARQSLPSAPAHCIGPLISSDTIGALSAMNQTHAPQGYGGADAVVQLDADGDGKLSVEEATAAIAGLDVDADGFLSADELQPPVRAIEPQAGYAVGSGGLAASAGELAAGLLEGLDADGDASLSLAETLAAWNGSELSEEEASEATSAFAGLDANGDGVLSLSELTAAIESYLQSARDEAQASILDAQA